MVLNPERSIDASDRADEKKKETNPHLTGDKNNFVRRTVLAAHLYEFFPFRLYCSA